ncbi:MAG TPA: helix-turn-helix domain-containing protein [Mycobacteriales bacterium]|nr:helix-turn-helix domain-containing protein [Mycobacteriales bacterium]
MSPQDSPLFARVEREIPKLARKMLDRFVAEVPLYSMLPREQLEGEISSITALNLRLFFASLRTEGPIPDEDLVEIRSSAARRAEERVPLDAVLAAYHIGGRMGWEALVEAAEPDEQGVLIVVAGRVLEFVQQVTGAVASAYLEERQSIYGEERDALRAVASALLAGEPADKLASRVGLTIAPSYVVLEISIGDHPDEHEHGVGGAVAARRKLRRVQGRLERWAGQPVVGLLEPMGGPVLIATTVEDSDKVIGALPDLVSELTDAAGAAVSAGVAFAATIGELSGATRQAGDVLALAAGLGRGAGAYTLSDVLLEYQLSRPSDALPALGLLLEPLERNPDLVLTLETYLAHDLDRRGTAAALHVHPNTLDYRLRRVVELTGIDPATTRGLQLVGAALAARRLRTSAGG